MGGAAAESACRLREGCRCGRVGLGGAVDLATITGLVETVGLDEGTSGLVSGRRESDLIIQGIGGVLFIQGLIRQILQHTDTDSF